MLFKYKCLNFANNYAAISEIRLLISTFLKQLLTFRNMRTLFYNWKMELKSFYFLKNAIPKISMPRNNIIKFKKPLSI